MVVIVCLETVESLESSTLTCVQLHIVKALQISVHEPENTHLNLNSRGSTRGGKFD